MIPGSGYRTVNDVTLEISLHLAMPYVYTTLAFDVVAGSNRNFQLVSLGTPTSAVYVGALLVVMDSVNGSEVVQITNVSSGVLTATFAYSHPAGTLVSAATWPIQQPTDPVFTQDEVVTYVSRAQNEILSRCPVVYQTSSSMAVNRQLVQQAPSNMVEMERVSLSKMSASGGAAVRDGLGNVTVTFGYDPGLVQGSTVTVYASDTDSSFLGAFLVSSVTAGGGSYVVSWLQDGVASSSTVALGYFRRLYEQTQEEVTMQQRTWRNDYSPVPTGWFEDRTGNYFYGLNVIPQSSFPVNLTYSIRDNDALTLLDGFVVPDVMVYIVKYKAMEYMHSKEGVWANPTLAKYCRDRAERGIGMVMRFFSGMDMAPGGSSEEAG